MNGYGLFVVLRLILGLGVLVGAPIATFIWFIWSELAREASYRTRFGVDWQAEFEKNHGSLASMHTKLFLAAFGLVLIPLTVFWLYRHLNPREQNQQGSRARGKGEHRRRESRVGRIVRYRRNAIIGNYFGVAGILASVLLVIFRFGIFEDHENEIFLGMAVFAAGYSGVVSGCWYWLKAKNLSEAIVFIALMPLGILFVPFVRLVFLANPLVLLAGMVMMPLILVVVVFVLPDNSHIPRKPPAWRELNESNRSSEREK